MDDDDWFSLVELSERLGALVWVEEQLFEIVGNWSTIEPVHSVAIFFAQASRHHAWHAEVVAECLPTSPQLEPASLVQAPTAGWKRAVATLRLVDGPEATATRLRGLVRVVDPWIARETASLLELARPVSDAPLARWLRFVEIDHLDDATSAAELLASVATNAVRLDEHVLIGELDLG